jgi:hypothetical protein
MPETAARRIPKLWGALETPKSIYHALIRLAIICEAIRSLHESCSTQCIDHGWQLAQPIEAPDDRWRAKPVAEHGDHRSLLRPKNPVRHSHSLRGLERKHGAGLVSKSRHCTQSFGQMLKLATCCGLDSAVEGVNRPFASGSR